MTLDTTEDLPDILAHAAHRFHWDANGSGDLHCSEHQEPGCTCIIFDEEPAELTPPPADR